MQGMNKPGRRTVTIGLLLALFQPRSAHAGEGGGNRDGASSGQTGSAGGTTSRPLEVISQDAILRMSGEEILKAQYRAARKNEALVVQGFTRNMTIPLQEMMQADPRSTRRLIRDMRKLNTKKARRARLAQEVKEQNRRIRVYTESIQEHRAISDSTSKAIADEDRVRRTNARKILDNTRIWMRDPKEGTY